MTDLPHYTWRPREPDEEQSRREWRSLVAGPWLSCERAESTELADPEGLARGQLIRFGGHYSLVLDGLSPKQVEAALLALRRA